MVQPQQEVYPLFGFSFHTHKPQLFYPFDRLYALKPKNPV